MGRRSASSSYVTPIKSDGVVQTESGTEFGRGSYTLAAGTYLYPLDGADSSIVSVHLQHDASVALTSCTIETCNLPDLASDSDGAAWYSTTAGHWIDEDPTTAFVGVVGANTTATNGVVAVTAGAAGGAMWHVGNNGARRTRLKVVCGTGGEIRVATWGKE